MANYSRGDFSTRVDYLPPPQSAIRKKLGVCRFCGTGNHLKCANATKNIAVCACRCIDKKSFGDY